MPNGIAASYATANVLRPTLLYTDRDCCNENGLSEYQQLFSAWKDMEVRLDIWHFMRRLARGCTSESHPLYGPFMAGLFSAKLMQAKKNKLKIA
ncbi:uncharacterized protein LOC130622895 [Hydractinia symbiolongicarpus]|uniref:uncharacterized protein LOC130622895 n=1 Tax=Hydractinia symbiolongicarpus TaxID=13093 RepID=UPI0025503690|nr:uncharacterized protein LOC130622895 [Hydractinia symbiolongicarpus]